ncbi:thioredoxin [Halalkalibacter wakoensis JCM 9140]|uniref:Thioredoxin n=1 Tax=Halalkalibacter wakoensis JCM 9140 TaxID=1236970 RepID=W4PZB6_9BACI|nr:thioredoxin family protein [Halalkalibacter wakoensis]GAE25015.1 thioredoxin [Halalkalibacter wakoensis JCM 9140]
MEDISYNELNVILAERRPVTVVFVYTPLCGTCKVAKDMISIVQATHESLPIFSVNINHSPSFAQNWKIKSVPCLLIFQKGLGVERVYAFQSIGFIHHVLKPYAAAVALDQEK